MGMDIAGELIGLAKEQSGENETYLVLAAEKMASLQSGRFDAAICVFYIFIPRPLFYVLICR